MSWMAPDQLLALIDRPGPAVSIFMPTHSAGPAIKQDPIRFGNLLSEAETDLQGMGLQRTDIQQILAPALELKERSAFWQHQRDGLALFAARDFLRTYRVPLPLEGLVVAGPSFHIKPLLPILSEDARFYLLALSQQEVRLLEGTRFGLKRVEVDNLPQSLDDAVRWDDPEATLQWHSGAGRAVGERRLAMFHGHGQEHGREHKQRIQRYFAKVAQAIDKILADQRAPLLLAGVDYLLPIYRQVTSYSHIARESILGNQQDPSEKTLHSRAWEILQPVFAQRRHAAMETYRSLVEQGSSRAVSGTREAVMAAYDGRVDTLFAALGVQTWGCLNARERTVMTTEYGAPGAVELLDLAAAHTLKKGGQVYAVARKEVPSRSDLAAILRY